MTIEGVFSPLAARVTALLPEHDISLIDRGRDAGK
jgi:hypothetical protein